jgi:trans-aconitate methyltransferase
VTAGAADDVRRSDLWQPIWTDRDHDRADWNGMEACFASLAVYERWAESTATMLIDELQLGPNDVVADLGCGTGRIAAHIAPHVAHVYGTDFSQTVIDVARVRRSGPNVSFDLGDLNTVDPATLNATKAYSVGALLYMDSEELARQLIAGLNARGIAFAAVDLPDEQVRDDVERAYDRSVYTHLQFSADRLSACSRTGE